LLVTANRINLRRKKLSRPHAIHTGYSFPEVLTSEALVAGFPCSRLQRGEVRTKRGATIGVLLMLGTFALCSAASRMCLPENSHSKSQAPPEQVTKYAREGPSENYQLNSPASVPVYFSKTAAPPSQGKQDLAPSRVREGGANRRQVGA